MSYCVNCGVELDQTAKFCPLCHVPVNNPAQPVDHTAPTPFPTERREVLPASKRELALLISAMLLSAALCCGLLNLILHPHLIWSLYVLGALAVVWVCFVPPLLRRGTPFYVQMGMDMLSVAVYILLIAWSVDGMAWYWYLAIPIILLLGGVFMILYFLLKKHRRSLLSSTATVLGVMGIFLIGVEFFIDQYLHQMWMPGWSLVVATICLSLLIPLLVVRWVPSLREEVRRRFHM